MNGDPTSNLQAATKQYVDLNGIVVYNNYTKVEKPGILCGIVNTSNWSVTINCSSVFSSIITANVIQTSTSTPPGIIISGLNVNITSNSSGGGGVFTMYYQIFGVRL